MKLSSLLTDTDLRKGVWIPYTEGVELLIASTDRADYQKALTRLSRAINHADLKAKPELMIGVTLKATAEALFLDFRGIEAEDGTPLPNTPSNRILLLSSSDLRDFVGVKASEARNFQREARQAEADDLKSGAGMAPEVGTGSRVSGAVVGAPQEDGAGA